MKKKLINCSIVFIMTVFVMIAGVFINTSDSEAASVYRIKINKQQNCVTIYKINSKGEYKPYKAMICSVGSATPYGTFGLKEKIRWHELEGPVYGQYCSRITGHILFHSVWYYQNGNPATLSNTQYNRLGSMASHGCVRLNVRDAKWIYDNCPSGTPVEIYASKDPGPLGKPESIKLPAGSGWDPTDVTNPANPYNKKKPSIKMAKGKKGSTYIKYNSSFNLLKTITAKNTTGFDVNDKVTYTIKYKAEKGKYVKVKKINTLKKGVYKVRFKLVDEIGRKASLKVKYTVLNKINLTSISLNKNNVYMYMGYNESCKLKLASYKPKKASIKDLTFVSSNPSVATVNNKGKVNAVAPGDAVITALSKDGSGVKTECQIHVRKYADAMVAGLEKSTINKGEVTRVLCTLLPAGATGQDSLNYTYVSSDSAVASVDAAGNVTGVSQGTAVITVTAGGAAANGAVLTSQVTVTVNEDSTQSDVSPGALTIQ